MKTIKYLINNWFQMTISSLLIGTATGAMIIFIIAGCTNPKDMQENDINYSLQHGVYVKHYKTNLCFFYQGHGYGRVLTNVPCTPAVESLIRHE